MKKDTYYFINYKGEKTRARNSANEYKYGLTIMINGEETCIKCSIRKDIIESEIKYLLKYNSEVTPDTIRIVEVFKE